MGTPILITKLSVPKQMALVSNARFPGGSGFGSRGRHRALEWYSARPLCSDLAMQQGPSSSNVPNTMGLHSSHFRRHTQFMATSEGINVIAGAYQCTSPLVPPVKSLWIGSRYKYRGLVSHPLDLMFVWRQQCGALLPGG